MKRLKYTLLAMMLITSLVVYAAVTTGSTLAMIIDQTLSLVNTFAPGEVTADGTVDIAIEKTVVASGVNSLDAGGFTFELTNLQTNDVLAAVSDVNGDATISLSFTEADIGNTYTYTLMERNDAREGYTYSDRIYDITITVQLQGNDLVPVVTMDGVVEEAPVAGFVNIYNPGGDVPPPPAGDGSMPMLYCMLAVVSLACMLFIAYSKRQHS